MNITVFSKDRALQLELFIRSFNKYVVDSNSYRINVLYTFSNTEYEKGYIKLTEMYPDVKFIKETNFKQDVISLINPLEDYTIYFVDDDIFKNKIDFYDKQEEIFRKDSKILCRSLRLDNTQKRCYTMNLTYSKFPTFIKNGNSLIFNWVNQQGDYGYPMSLDGHIFRTQELLPYINNLSYNNPNSLEGNMAAWVSGHQTIKQKMICYEQSIIVNNPCNIVQTNNSNLHGSENPIKLNSDFLSGKIISLENIDGIENISCHQEIKIIIK